MMPCCTSLSVVCVYVAQQHWLSRCTSTRTRLCLFIRATVLIDDRRVIRAAVPLPRQKSEVGLRVRPLAISVSCLQQVFGGFSCFPLSENLIPSLQLAGVGGTRLRPRPCHRLCVIPSFSCAGAPRGAPPALCHWVQTAVFLSQEQIYDWSALTRQEAAGS